MVPDDTPVAPEAPMAVVSPLQGEVVAAFSVDQLLYDETLEDWRTHDGVDIAAPEGDPVLAACAGTVVSVDDDALMGTTVVLRHTAAMRPPTPISRPLRRWRRGNRCPPGRSSAPWAPPPRRRPPRGPTCTLPSPRTARPVDPDAFLEP